MTHPILSIKNLKAKIEEKEILKGLNLEVNAGEIHAIMGPNGSGKSTFASILAGKEGYEITEGEILYKNKNLLSLLPEERAREGLFLAFQYPVEIPGVSSITFLKTAVNEIRIHRGLKPFDAMDFLKYTQEKKNVIDIHETLTNRSVNEGFSGGEKKKFEIFQMAMLEPTLCVLDETDSGLDIDALKVVSAGINALRSKENAFILITHYQRLLDYITPDFVHILYQGEIVKSGGKDLAGELEEKGYNDVKEAFEIRSKA